VPNRGRTELPGTPSLAAEPLKAETEGSTCAQRVPTLLISPYIEAGTVFRSPTDVPYDHTSILATLRYWLDLLPQKMLTGERVRVAPTFGNVLTRSAPRTDLPKIAPSCVSARPILPKFALNNLQRRMLVGYAHSKGGRTIGRGAEILLRRGKKVQLP
jgi:phospholipase C